MNNLAVFLKTGNKLFLFGDEAKRVGCPNLWLEVYDENDNILLAVPAVEVVAYKWNPTNDDLTRFWKG